MTCDSYNNKVGSSRADDIPDFAVMVAATASLRGDEARIVSEVKSDHDRAKGEGALQTFRCLTWVERYLTENPRLPVHIITMVKTRAAVTMLSNDTPLPWERRMPAGSWVSTLIVGHITCHMSSGKMERSRSVLERKWSCFLLTPLSARCDPITPHRTYMLLWHPSIRIALNTKSKFISAFLVVHESGVFVFIACEICRGQLNRALGPSIAQLTNELTQVLGTVGIAVGSGLGERGE